MIVKCSCKHEVQDKIHGKHRRVANPTAKKTTEGRITVRCTVCLAEQQVNK